MNQDREHQGSTWLPRTPSAGSHPHLGGRRVSYIRKNPEKLSSCTPAEQEPSWASQIAAGWGSPSLPPQAWDLGSRIAPPPSSSLNPFQLPLNSQGSPAGLQLLWEPPGIWHPAPLPATIPASAPSRPFHPADGKFAPSPCPPPPPAAPASKSKQLQWPGTGARGRNLGVSVLELPGCP